jgi:CarboxypepD_reg-like domain
MYSFQPKSIMKKQFCILYFIFFQVITGFAQSPYVILERAISIRLTNTPLKEALKEVSRTGRFEFAYDARIFDLTKKITLITNGLTVRETLFQMVGDNYSYQQKGDYLIIKKSDKSKQFISGYISDAKTGKRVSNATVYDAKTLRSTTTDENGFYTLKVAQRSTVVVAQLEYKDTTLQITEGGPRFVKLDLDIKTQPKPFEKTIDWGGMPSKLANFFISPLHRLNDLNVEDSIHRRFQLSLLPYIGTNHSMSGNVVNDVSINTLVGYSKGNRVLELSGFGSFTKGDIKGVQASGFFNIVRGRVQGVQMGGFFNTVKGNVHGVQVAGFFNYIGDTLSSVQLAGFSNYTHHAQAVNQSAGFINTVTKGSAKTQFAGFANIADSINGGQAAGFYNHAKNVKGVQISGFLNTAKLVKGVQIGVFNYADSLKGLQIGLFNYARKGGYNVLELSVNELNAYNITYKSGHKKFYTAFTAGISPKGKGNIWSYGGGIGTMIKLNNWSDVNIESLFRHINVGSFDSNRQEWLQLGLYWNIRLSNRFEIGVGPSYNAYFTNKNDPQYAENQGKIFPSFISRKQYGSGNFVADTWVGGSVGLRVKL